MIGVEVGGGGGLRHCHLHGGTGFWVRGRIRKGFTFEIDVEFLIKAVLLKELYNFLLGV